MATKYIRYIVTIGIDPSEAPGDQCATIRALLESGFPDIDEVSWITGTVQIPLGGTEHGQ